PSTECTHERPLIFQFRTRKILFGRGTDIRMVVPLWISQCSERLECSKLQVNSGMKATAGKAAAFSSFVRKITNGVERRCRHRPDLAVCRRRAPEFRRLVRTGHSA